MIHINLTSKLYQGKEGVANRKEQWALGRSMAMQKYIHLTWGT